MTPYIILFIIVDLLAIGRVMLRPHREPTARIAWVAVIALVPLIGILAYFLLGEVNIGSKRIEKLKNNLVFMPQLAMPKVKNKIGYLAKTNPDFEHLFKLGKSISGFDPLGGNQAELMQGSSAMINAMVADIDAAKHHVHVLFYIWLTDESGLAVIAALKNASKRGVKCRVLVDSIGSSTLLRSKYWIQMKVAGVELGEILPIGNPIKKILLGRIDLRNHRKIVVVDGDITYCGSQNCADAAFAPKEKYGPWVDAVLRIKGPIARQNQHLFISDWMICTGQDITTLLRPPVNAKTIGFTAQVIGTGPTDRHLAMSQMFVALIAAARENITITTPYYVPNEPIQSALQSAAHRGVITTIVFPEFNDSWVVRCASHSYYKELLEAGVHIYEFHQGLLHTKSITIDGQFTMIGSANLDRRSFDLNYENNMLIDDVKVTKNMLERQREYITSSNRVTLGQVEGWSKWRTVWNNMIATLGPIL